MRPPMAPAPWPQAAVIALWGNWHVFIPWRLRVAIWNWMWEYEGDERVDWRSRKKFSEGSA